MYTTRFFANVMQKLVFEYSDKWWVTLQMVAADSELLQHTSIISIFREEGILKTRCIGLHRAPYMLLGTGTDLLHCQFCPGQNPGNVEFDEFVDERIIIRCRTCGSQTPLLSLNTVKFVAPSDKEKRRNIYTFDFPFNDTHKTLLSGRMVQSKKSEKLNEVQLGQTKEGQEPPAKRHKGASST